MREIRFTVKTKIWITVLSIVLMFAFFVLFYLPSYQGQYLLNNFNKEINNHARTVALGVRIAITEEHFEGVQTAMDFVKDEPSLLYVSLVQKDTIWNEAHTKYTIERKVFKTYPDSVKVDVNATSTNSAIIKIAPFESPVMNGEILIAESTAGVISRVNQIRKIALFVSFVILAIGILLGFALAKNISIPVLALRDAASKVGEGDLTQRVEPHSKDEIGELGVAFNKMVDDLSLAQRSLQEKTSALIEEKKKSDELLEDLQITLQDLKNTQELLIRQEKLASVGQLTKGIVDRLLNPLNYINNFSLLSTDLAEEIKEFLTRVKDKVDEDAYNDVADVLEMVKTNLTKINEHGTSASRIIKGMEKLLKEKSNQFVETDFNKLIATEVEMSLREWKLLAPNLAVNLVTRYAELTEKIRILPAEMSSVIVNLFNNSLYSVVEKATTASNYSPEIIITTSIANGYYKFSIRDNGRGIAVKEKASALLTFLYNQTHCKRHGPGFIY